MYSSSHSSFSRNHRTLVRQLAACSLHRNCTSTLDLARTVTHCQTLSARMARRTMERILEKSPRSSSWVHRPLLLDLVGCIAYTGVMTLVLDVDGWPCRRGHQLTSGAGALRLTITSHNVALWTLSCGPDGYYLLDGLYASAEIVLY
ncbi:hypothetical protein PILCRDRAFT_309464 [Piloderma croceum F 1598]|uniref:Uncharacterized protein n=1 Tax=Piloderma croceum (strain F 1598) TaxID=765440 RepID=A0A0C3CAB6_PILCF|nr:hypothetical protein PILCRDRAFT_309464 [Piloderma croceum F 1598]